jgi:hypothetical protein
MVRFFSRLFPKTFARFETDEQRRHFALILVACSFLNLILIVTTAFVALAFSRPGLVDGVEKAFETCDLPAGGRIAELVHTEDFQHFGMRVEGGSCFAYVGPSRVQVVGSVLKEGQEGYAFDLARAFRSQVHLAAAAERARAADDVSASRPVVPTGGPAADAARRLIDIAWMVFPALLAAGFAVAWARGRTARRRPVGGHGLKGPRVAG